MDTQVFSTQDPQAIPRALAVLQNNGLVAFPTDTVYGVGCLAYSPVAIERIYIAKGRDIQKAIPILFGDLSQWAELVEVVQPYARCFAEQFWPGPLTLVVKKRMGLPAGLSPSQTIGVRIPDHPFALSLLRRTGPLATTSANLSGNPEAKTALEVYQQLAGRVELILDGGPTPGGAPSTVVDCTGVEPKILREGPILAAALRPSRCS